MSEINREVRETTVADGEAVQTNRQVSSPAAESDHNKFVAARVVWFIAGVIIVLLALRFVFVLLGANPNAGLAQFVYGITAPLVAPFFGLFGYHYTAGQARFEVYTLVAIAIYALVAWGLSKLFTLTRRTA